MWLLKTCAISAGMYARQVWAIPFSQHGKGMGDPETKMAANCDKEDYYG